MSRHFDITALDLRRPAGKNLKFETCDIRDKASLFKKLLGADLVINTAVIQVPEINEKMRLGYEVNVLGIQNLCEATESIGSIKGLLHTGSWHVFGEKGLRGVLDEEFGFRPDKIEERARLYALTKIAQESVIRVVAKASKKYYGVIRLGTVLGEGMPRQTAANLFIENALRGEPMTPFRHTQHRPMLYVDVQDVCKAFTSLAIGALSGRTWKDGEGAKIVNLVYPVPITILELAIIVRKSVIKLTHGRIRPKVKVIDKGMKSMYSASDKNRFKVDVSRARELLGSYKLTSPRRSIERIIKSRIDA
jgi:nucleoside-diphosphate-sugar epimerase